MLIVHSAYGILKKSLLHLVLESRFGKLRPYFRKVILAPFDGVCSTDIWVVRATEKCNQRFLFYWMASQEFVDKANKGSEGTKMPRAKWDFVSRIEKEIPVLEEQKRIAHILGTLDDKIELNQRMNRTLEDIALAVFKSWFVDFDPVRAKMAGEPFPLPDEIMALFPDRLVESELGLIPEGWEVKALSEIAIFLNGTACQKYPAKSEKKSLPVLKIRELRAGEFSDQSDKASMDIPNKYIVNNGDVIFSWSGSLLVDIWTGGKGFLNQHLFKVTSENYPKWFYYYWIKHHLDEFQRIAEGKATTMGHIKRNHLDEALVCIPNNELFGFLDSQMCTYMQKQITNDLGSMVCMEIRNNVLEKLF